MVSDHGEEVILYQEKQNKKQKKKIKLKNGKLRKYPRPILTEQA